MNRSLNFFFWTVWSSEALAAVASASTPDEVRTAWRGRGGGYDPCRRQTVQKKIRNGGASVRRSVSRPRRTGHGGARSVVGIGSASRDADLPSALARMVRFLPCVDMTHLRACPLVGRLRARDVRTRVSVSGRIGPEGAGRSGRAMVRDAAAVASGRNVVWSDLPRRPSGRCPFFRGRGCRALGRPGQGAVDPSPVRFF